MSANITDTIRRIAGGTLVDEANDKLAALVQGVTATGKAGSITIKINLKAVGGGALSAKVKITAAIPADAPQTTPLFATPEGALLTEDPKQAKLDPRQVAPQTYELKEAKG